MPHKVDSFNVSKDHIDCLLARQPPKNLFVRLGVYMSAFFNTTNIYAHQRSDENEPESLKYNFHLAATRLQSVYRRHMVAKVYRSGVSSFDLLCDRCEHDIQSLCPQYSFADYR